MSGTTFVRSSLPQPKNLFGTAPGREHGRVAPRVDGEHRAHLRRVERRVLLQHHRDRARDVRRRHRGALEHGVLAVVDRERRLPAGARAARDPRRRERRGDRRAGRGQVRLRSRRRGAGRCPRTCRARSSPSGGTNCHGPGRPGADEVQLRLRHVRADARSSSPRCAGAPIVMSASNFVANTPSG